MLKYRFYIIIALIWFGILALHSLPSPMLVYGDHHSDADVLTAGENFLHNGFAATKGLPINQRDDMNRICQNGIQTCVYTHYPPLPYAFNGLLRQLGFESLTWFRLVALLISFATVLILPFAFYEITLNWQLSYFASLAYIFNARFVNYVDSLHQFPPVLFAFILFVFSWVRFLRQSKSVYFILSLLAFLLSTWVSFEHFAFIPIVALGSTLLLKKFKTHWPYVFAVGLLPIVTLGFRIWHNSLVYNSLVDALKDMRGTAEFRASISWFEMLRVFGRRFGDFILVSFFAIIYLFSRIKSKYASLFRLQWTWVFLFFVGGASWWVLMRQHARIHPHAILVYLPFLSLLFAFAMFTLYEEIRDRKRLHLKILFSFFAFLWVIHATSTGLMNRWIEFYPPKYNEVQNMQKSIKALQEFIAAGKAWDTYYVDEWSHNVAYHSGLKFSYLKRQDMCNSEHDKYPVILTAEDEDTIKPCMEMWGKPNQVGSYFLFQKPKPLIGK